MSFELPKCPTKIYLIPHIRRILHHLKRGLVWCLGTTNGILSQYFVTLINFGKKTLFPKTNRFRDIGCSRFFMDSTRAIYSSGEMGRPRWYIGPQTGILLTSFVTLINFENKKLFPKVNRFWDIGCLTGLLGFRWRHLQFRRNGNT